MSCALGTLTIAQTCQREADSPLDALRLSPASASFQFAQRVALIFHAEIVCPPLPPGKEPTNGQLGSCASPVAAGSNCSFTCDNGESYPLLAAFVLRAAPRLVSPIRSIVSQAVCSVMFRIRDSRLGVLLAAGHDDHCADLRT